MGLVTACVCFPSMRSSSSLTMHCNASDIKEAVNRSNQSRNGVHERFTSVQYNCNCRRGVGQHPWDDVAVCSARIMHGESRPNVRKDVFNSMRKLGQHYRTSTAQLLMHKVDASN